MGTDRYRKYVKAASSLTMCSSISNEEKPPRPFIAAHRHSQYLVVARLTLMPDIRSIRKTSQSAITATTMTH
jgi:hypothetical protein